MDYIRQYKSFINSYYLSEGIRITIGLTLPALILSYFGQLPAGIMMSLGASCVIMVDNAGPIHHRRNAMLICNALIFLVSLCTGFAAHSPVILGILITLFCFSFSMIGVFGSRASSIGLAGLFVMVLNIDRNDQGWQIAWNAALVLAGGLWYALLSLTLYSFRPFKLAQQALGDCIESCGDYLRTKASFYSRQADPEKIYPLLLKQQASIHEKQNLVRELLFKSRNIVKDSTKTGRTLLLVFLDIVDLFERVMNYFPDYETLHRFFEEEDILGRYEQLMLAMADELNEIGVAIAAGKPFPDNGGIGEKVRALRSYFEQFRDEKRSAANVEGFFILRQVMEAVEDIGDRLHILHNYTSYDDSLGRKTLPDADYYDQFVTHQDVDLRLLSGQFSLRSNTFRHALRVSMATLTGYIISTFLPVGHSYWILLTIIVILKPAYSLTKKRNYDRLLGTIAGAVIGLLVIHFVRKKDGIFACMVVFMVIAYSFMRIRYLVFVLMMTPYILILFYLLNPVDFNLVITDRVIDTAIGSAIAFLANITLFPAWEHEQITDYLLGMLNANKKYFQEAVKPVTQAAVAMGSYKIARKNAYVALANLSDAFNRMLSEPKRKQKNPGSLYQFTVLNHQLTSYIGSLASYASQLYSPENEKYFQPVIQSISKSLDRAEDNITEPIANPSVEDKEPMRALNEQLGTLLSRRKSELDQGITESDTRKRLSVFKPIADRLNFISKIAGDLEKMNTSYR